MEKNYKVTVYAQGKIQKRPERLKVTPQADLSAETAYNNQNTKPGKTANPGGKEDLGAQN